MLAALRIQNLALVEDLTWEPGPGLIAVTGETGAGKSIIVGAIKLLLGERADRSLIRTGYDTCLVDALFSLADPSEINAILLKSGFEPCLEGELHIRRTLASSGANRQYLNGSPAPLTLLKEVGDRLVDLHGAHDHHSLMARDRQLALLDKFGVPPEAQHRYHNAYRLWADSLRSLQQFENYVLLSDTERNLLRHQADEISAANLVPGEDETLRQKYALVSQHRRFLELTTLIQRVLNDEPGGIFTNLQTAQRAAGDLERLDPTLAPALESLSRTRTELEDLQNALETRSRELNMDPEQAAALEERLDLVESLRRKYGGSLHTVLAHQENATQKLAAAENRVEEGAKLRAALDKTRCAVNTEAKILHDLRLNAAPKLATAIASHFKDLGFQRAIFEIALDNLTEPTSNGTDAIDFHFSPNPGEPAKPLRLIASSGEMARVMLAVKCALAAQDNIPLLIFDEIDANVGGSIAEAVGDKMRSLANGQQVISITHLPQVASRGDSHFLVTKDFSGGRTRSLMHQISSQNRLEEIARMLGGSPESALHHATSLLNESAAQPLKKPMTPTKSPS